MAEISAARLGVTVLAVASRGCAQGSAHTLARQVMSEVVEPLVAELRCLEDTLGKPCGSCHPCVNWVDETWRRDGRKPPRPDEWDALRAQRQAVLDLCDEEIPRGRPYGVFAKRVRRLLTGDGEQP